jgi:hypothetical protein
MTDLGSGVCIAAFDTTLISAGSENEQQTNDIRPPVKDAPMQTAVMFFVNQVPAP